MIEFFVNAVLTIIPKQKSSMKTIPPEVINALYGLAMAVIGWLVKKLSKSKAEKVGAAVLNVLNDPFKPNEVTVYKSESGKTITAYGEPNKPAARGSQKN